MTDNVRVVRHAGIVVENLEKQLHFYCDVLDFTVQRRMEESGPFIDHLLAMQGVQVTTAKLIPPGGGAMIELLEFHAPDPDPRCKITVKTFGLTHVALTVGNLSELKSKLEAAGTKFLGAPRVSADGRAIVSYCRDPEGNFLELVEEVT